VAERPEILAFSPMDLTNKRIHVILQEVNKRQFLAWDSKTIKDIEAYFNALKVLFLEVEPLLDKDEIDRIKAKMNEISNDYKALIFSKKIKPSTILNMLEKLDKVNESIRVAMQIHEYFFKKTMKKAMLEDVLRELLPKYVCKKCGREVNTNWNFCSFCGNQIRNEKGDLIESSVKIRE